MNPIKYLYRGMVHGDVPSPDQIYIKWLRKKKGKFKWVLVFLTIILTYGGFFLITYKGGFWTLAMFFWAIFIFPFVTPSD